MLKLAKIHPTVLFIRQNEKLLQAIDVHIENSGQSTPAQLNVKIGSQFLNFNLANINEGESNHRLFIPDIRENISVEFMLKAQDKEQDHINVDWTPRKHWEIFLIPIAHHDLGYTDTIERVLNTYCEIFDDVLKFCQETENWSEESKFRYMVEEAWSIKYFVDRIDEEKRQKLSKYIKEGRIEIPALFGNQISGMCGHEELIRLMYPSFRISREFGAKIRSGSITDIPGLSWGLPTILSGAGVKFFFAGLPTYFQWGRNDVHTFWDEDNILRKHGRPDAFYWQGPDGSKVLVFYQGGYGCWSPQSYDQILRELPAMLDEMDQKGCAFSVMRYGGYGCGDNTKTDIIVSCLVKEWNSKWEYPKLIVGTNAMFFEKLSKQCNDVRIFIGELPHTDYAVGAMSSAKETTINRNTHDRLNSAEKLATIANLLTDSHYPADDIRNAYECMLLYDEHTWGMAHQVGYIQDWAWSEKSSYSYKSAGLTEIILSNSARALADSISFDDENQHIVVFNTLSFNRTDLVNMPFYRDNPFKLIDIETGQEVPYQITVIDDPHLPIPYSAGRFARGQFNPPELYNLVFVAENVPSMGYKTYKIVQTENKRSEHICFTLGEYEIENRFFNIRLNPKTGTIESIYDKELSIELIDGDSEHQANQLIVRWVKTGQLESPKSAVIRKGKNGSVCASLLVSSYVVGCPQITQEITLYDKVKRIDIANLVLKDTTPTMEVYFAFPFKVENPEFMFEGTNSVIKPLRDQFPGSNSNYYSVQHWADVSNSHHGITFCPIDAHLVEFGGLNPCYVSQAHHGVTPPDFGTDFVKELKKGYMYSFVIDSNFRTNFQATQLGEILFRYSITTHKGNWLAGCPRDFGWAVCNPFISVVVDPRKQGGLATSMSFCQIDKPNVIVSALKRAEDNNGIIVRLTETEGKETEVNLSFSVINPQKAFETDLVEENKRPLDIDDKTIKIDICPYGIKTVRITTNG